MSKKEKQAYKRGMIHISIAMCELLLFVYLIVDYILR